MRITSGKFRSRIIKMPRHIRPTQDKVRKALFDILGDISGLSFLELFAGSAAVGLEAASRGIEDLVLVEQDPTCFATIRENVASLKLKASSLYQQEAERAIKNFHRNKRKFDIVFLDPPYHKARASEQKLRNLTGEPELSSNKGVSLAKKTLQILEAYDILTVHGLIVVQHFKKDILPEELGVLTLLRKAAYGDSILSFYRKKD